MNFVMSPEILWTTVLITYVYTLDFNVLMCVKCILYRVSPKTLLTFCTNGVLLRTLMAGEQSLSTVTHVIVVSCNHNLVSNRISNVFYRLSCYCELVIVLAFSEFGS